MQTFSTLLLSGSTNGRNVPVVATATPGTLIHTAVTGTAAFDEIYAWAANVTGTAATLTIEFGGVTDPGDHLVKALTLPPNSPPYPIATGQKLNNGLVMRAFSGTASAVNISGFVNRVQ